MEKKIIAIALVLVVMVTVFVGCSKKRETINYNGKEYILYTDKEGNTKLNEQNQLIVVVTDEQGEVLTYANGEDQTRPLQIFNNLVVGDEVAGANYRFKVPEGWEGNDSGHVYKKNTDKKCYIKFDKVTEFEKGKNLDTYLDVIDEQNEQLKAGIPQAEGMKGAKLTVNKSEKTITVDNLQSVLYVYKIVDKDGKTIHYAENFYFSSGDTAYKVSYVCQDGVGYDAGFNFTSYVNSNFKFVK